MQQRFYKGRQDLARGPEADWDEMGPLGLEHVKWKAEPSS